MPRKSNTMRKEVVAHLRDDIKTFHDEAKEDKKLIKKLSKKGPKMPGKKSKKGADLVIVIGKKPKKKQSMEDRYREHSGEERAEHGYHKSKNPKRSFKRFEEKEERKAMKHKDKPGAGAKKRGKLSPKLKKK